MKNLELQKCILGPVYTNCYLLKNKETGELIIVDPADCPEKIEMKISRMNGKPCWHKATALSTDLIREAG